jgi:hypothetical protein
VQCHGLLPAIPISGEWIAKLTGPVHLHGVRRHPPPAFALQLYSFTHDRSPATLDVGDTGSLNLGSKMILAEAFAQSSQIPRIYSTLLAIRWIGASVLEATLMDEPCSKLS